MRPVMVSSCITYLLLVQSVHGTCTGNAASCKAHSFSQILMVQRHVGTSSGKMVGQRAVVQHHDEGSSASEDDDLGWLAPRGYANPPIGMKIAIAYRGGYHRRLTSFWGQRGGGVQEGADQNQFCSDWWMSRDNIARLIINPLKGAGAEVRTYFHTLNDTACPSFNDKLVRDMGPTDYLIEDAELLHSTTSGYSFIKVLQLVGEWADVTLLLRFDVSYKVPITRWNIQWDMFNVASRGATRARSAFNDLFFIAPREYVGSFIKVLSSPGKYCEQLIGRPTSNSLGVVGWSQNCLQALEGAIGSPRIHFIDPEPTMSGGTDSFCYIDRSCSQEYLDCVA